MMLKGMTAEYLLNRTFKVKPGMTILVHAAAGGVGLILCQWGKHLGATVIGTVGSKDKADLAKANGCDHAILYRNEDFVARTKEITGGGLCDVVYDGVGKDTFPASLDCLHPLGMFVSFGSSSGRSTPSTSTSCRPKVRCSRPGRRSITTPPSAPICSPSRTICSRWSRAAR